MPPGRAFDAPLPVPKDIAGWGLERTYTEPVGEIPRQASIPPYWQLKPPAGIDMFSDFRGTLAAGAGSQLVIPLSAGATDYVVLQGYGAVVASFIIFVDTPLTTMDITFALLNNGAPVPGWILKPFPVAANAIIQPLNGTLQIGDSSKMSVLVTNNAASGPWNVGAQIAGWQWPRIEEQRVFGAR